VIARGAGPFGGGSGNAILIFALILIVFAYLQGGLPFPLQNAGRDPLAFVAFIVAIGLGITFHEFMHAYTAHRLGDDTARLLGRMTLDPRAHLDVFGSLLIVLIGFGYGKPVPVNESRLRNGRTGMAIVSLAGPFTNIVLATAVGLPIVAGAMPLFGGEYHEFLGRVATYNLLLGVFNVLPIPPLDGSKVVYGMLPARQAWAWRSYEQYGPFILLAILFLLPYLGVNLLRPLVFVPACFLADLVAGGCVP
jgi:Zn-dependent protease